MVEVALVEMLVLVAAGETGTLDEEQRPASESHPASQ